MMRMIEFLRILIPNKGSEPKYLTKVHSGNNGSTCQLYQSSLGLTVKKSYKMSGGVEKHEYGEI